MSPESETVGRWLLQLLYENYDNYASGSDLSVLLEIDECSVIDRLNHLVESELVEQKDEKYRLSDKGYRTIHQRFTSFCPHL